jgi:hypothetical protein
MKYLAVLVKEVNICLSFYSLFLFSMLEITQDHGIKDGRTSKQKDVILKSD